MKIWVPCLYIFYRRMSYIVSFLYSVFLFVCFFAWLFFKIFVCLILIFCLSVSQNLSTIFFCQLLLYYGQFVLTCKEGNAYCRQFWTDSRLIFNNTNLKELAMNWQFLSRKVVFSSYLISFYRHRAMKTSLLRSVADIRDFLGKGEHTWRRFLFFATFSAYNLFFPHFSLIFFPFPYFSSFFSGFCYI